MGPKSLVRGLQDLSKMSKNMFIASKLSKIPREAIYDELILRYTPLIFPSRVTSSVIRWQNRLFWKMLVCVFYSQNVAISKSRHWLLFYPTRKEKSTEKFPPKLILKRKTFPTTHLHTSSPRNALTKSYQFQHYRSFSKVNKKGL